MKPLRNFSLAWILGLLPLGFVGCATWSPNVDLRRSNHLQSAVSQSQDTLKPPPVVRGQGFNPSYSQTEAAPGTDHFRQGMPVSGGDYVPSGVAQIPATAPNSNVQPVQFQQGSTSRGAQAWAGATQNPLPTNPWQGSMPPVGQPVVRQPTAPQPIIGQPVQPPVSNIPNGNYPPTNYSQPVQAQPAAPAGLGGYPPAPNVTYQNPPLLGGPAPNLGQSGQTWAGPQGGGGVMGVPTPYADVFVNVAETQTGKLMIGAAVNSDAGVTGQIVIDERNFDWRAIPTSFDDFANGSAFRGAGQGFRLEALPGDEVQRYMLQFTNPYLFDTRVSMNLSGFLFDRRYFDWDERRLGGRLGFGYRVGPDLSLGFSVRAEEIKVDDPRVNTVTQLNDVLGKNELYSGRVTLTQDTRNIPFAPTQGYFLELAYEQVFGTFDYGRFEGDFRRYFLLNERPDGSGRHVLGFSNRIGISGEETPLFENFFAGGYQTMRGFDFRRAVPMVDDVGVGGRFRLLGSVEYLFPITADDMLKGVIFTDYGTVEEDIKIEGDDFRVALGAGLRITIPAMGPAPIALDFAVPVAREDTDEIRNFSFFMGVSR